MTGCSFTSTQTTKRTVRQGLRTPDGKVMFIYEENKSDREAPQPGLLRCDVSNTGSVSNCDRFVISYQMRQTFRGYSGDSLYVYEDPDNPGPSNRGVVKCGTKWVGDTPLPTNCKQRNISNDIQVGPGKSAMFLYETVGEETEQESGGMSLFSGSSSEEEEMVYPEPEGAMQCDVTGQGMLTGCKKLEITYGEANDEEA
jgi:hypothetical protein